MLILAAAVDNELSQRLSGMNFTDFGSDNENWTSVECGFEILQ